VRSALFSRLVELAGAKVDVGKGVRPLPRGHARGSEGQGSQRGGEGKRAAAPLKPAPAATPGPSAAPPAAAARQPRLRRRSSGRWRVRTTRR
jgi:hypothetical protein